MASGTWPGGIVSVRLLVIQVVRGQGSFHVPAWIRPTKGGERCPRLRGETSYLCAVLFRLPITVGQVGHERPKPLVFAHRGLLC